MPDILTLRAEELWREGKKIFSKKNKFWYMKHHFQFARQILKTIDQLIFGSKSMKARHNTNSWKISLWHKKNFYRKILPAAEINWTFALFEFWDDIYFILLYSFIRFFIFWCEIHIKNIKWIFLSHTFLRYGM